jgi:hypothetical protein
MLRYYDIDGNALTGWPLTNDDPDGFRIGDDDLPGGVRVSTVHLTLDHQWNKDGAPLIFETMVFGGEHDEWQCRYATKENAAAGHKATVAWVLHEGPEPEGDYAMTRAEWLANR